MLLLFSCFVAFFLAFFLAYLVSCDHQTWSTLLLTFLLLIVWSKSYLLWNTKVSLTGFDQKWSFLLCFETIRFLLLTYFETLRFLKTLGFLLLSYFETLELFLTYLLGNAKVSNNTRFLKTLRYSLTFRQSADHSCLLRTRTELSPPRCCPVFCNSSVFLLSYFLQLIWDYNFLNFLTMLTSKILHNFV